MKMIRKRFLLACIKMPEEKSFEKEEFKTFNLDSSAIPKIECECNVWEECLCIVIIYV